MRRWITFFILVGALGLTACAPAAPTTPPKKSGTIRIGFPTTADLGDVPALMAQEVLSAQGYTIQPTAFNGAELQAAALAQGEIDFAHGSMRTIWGAIGKGVDARTIMEQLANNWVFIAKPEYKTCADLAGKRLAFTSSSSLNRALFDAYMQSKCPDLKFDLLLISSSDSRAAALLAGEIDATPLELADWIQVQQKDAQRFHVLIDFMQELPRLKTTGVYVHRAFAEQKPDVVRDYVRALLTVHRAIQTDPTQLQNAAIKYLKLDAAVAQTITQAYLTRKMWDVNGGLTRDDVQASLDFFTTTKTIPEGLTVDVVADLSFLNAVLDEIGRK